MYCVHKCEFQGCSNGDTFWCKFHNLPLERDTEGIRRCKPCERHTCYNKVCDIIDEVADEYNDFVVSMDEKIEKLYAYVDIVRDKI